MSVLGIMTALLLCENAELSEEITVSAGMLKVEGSSMGLLAGDRVTYHDLLYGMMLASGNDAANVTAYVLGGTVNGFVKMMNFVQNNQSALLVKRGGVCAVFGFRQHFFDVRHTGCRGI